MAKLNVNIRSPSFHTNFIASLWKQNTKCRKKEHIIIHNIKTVHKKKRKTNIKTNKSSN